ncbi:unnamed protein product [Linum tenue]|uniref:Uncharacterized protein n=1 Tax=Linum tenue TaxID=586396 RepID=A0AAV0P2J3_9ROSI|nr:unnamed protein product [Linum tenue]
MKGFLVDNTPLDPLAAYTNKNKQNMTELAATVAFSPNATVSHDAAKRALHVVSEEFTIFSDYTRVAGTLVRKSDTRHLAGATAHCLFASDLDDRNTKILQLEHQLKEGHEGSNQELQEELSKDHEAADTKKDAELAVVREELKQAKEDTKHF